MHDVAHQIASNPYIAKTISHNNAKFALVGKLAIGLQIERRNAARHPVFGNRQTAFIAVESDPAASPHRRFRLHPPLETNAWSQDPSAILLDIWHRSAPYSGFLRRRNLFHLCVIH